MPSNPQLFVVIGDVHDAIELAREFLIRLEVELRQEIVQVFSVGDFGLFLDAESWSWFTGPGRYRRPERTSQILKGWGLWRSPHAQISGNHENLAKLRDFAPDYFANKLSYTNAGLLAHKLPGVRVAGLSGINCSGTNAARTPPNDKTWREIVAMCRTGKLSRRALTYYREADIDELLKVESPHILLTHDWLIDPPHAKNPGEYRPESTIVDLLKPKFHFAGHHHAPYQTMLPNGTQFIALNIIASANQHQPNPGWAWIGTWDDEAIHENGFWPPLE